MAFKIIECPRDAMQGISRFIRTEDKARYINALLRVGFDTLDFGSFVSARAIPQMRDTAEVLRRLEPGGKTRLLAIVANNRGADLACQHEEISYLGFPFSVSETFQLRNTNSTIEESVDRVLYMQELCTRKGKQLVVYLSMGFGNPYGDPWNAEIVAGWLDRIVRMGVRTVSLSDTVGVADPESIRYLFSSLIPAYPDIEIGAHLHTRPENWKEKVEAAYRNGCRRFDGAIKGYGGCPMAADQLTGNMPTENLISYLQSEEPEALGLDMDAFGLALREAARVFNH